MKKTQLSILLSFSFALVLMFSSACDVFGFSEESIQKLSFAETVFEAVIAQPIEENDQLFLEIIDEVTGIALNPSRYELEKKDNFSYFIRLPLAIGSVIKYRFVLVDQTGNQIEHDSLGKSMLYRTTIIKKAAIVHDFISGWDSNRYQGKMGEISGFIYDQSNDAPLADIIVFINGQQTVTTTDGYYELQNIPVGEFNLVAIHPDGDYVSFQQAAMIAENSITPASFGMQPAKRVNVTFNVQVPSSEPTLGEMRLITNLYSYGNTFGEQRGGISILASSAPILNKKNEREYTLTLDLPEGFDLRYKFSLGDGFINAEHAADGSFRTRQLIVPSKNLKVNQIISTWFSQGNQPIQFNVNVPSNTPSNDIVTIQFNPYTWMEPLPMVKTNPTSWFFTLFSPQEYMQNMQFRICRNYQCGLADDALTTGDQATGYQLNLNETASVVEYDIEAWVGLSSLGPNMQSISIPPSHNIYIKAIEMDEKIKASSIHSAQWDFSEAATNGANMVIFTPTWSFSSDDHFNLQIGTDWLSEDLRKAKSHADELELASALFPQPRYLINPNDYWNSISQSYQWWQDWLAEYQRFILNFADFAERNGIQTLMIGGSSIAPSFPNGSFPDGTPSSVTSDANNNWGEIIDQIRAHFSGQLFFALPYSTNLDKSPAFLSQVDAIYLEFSSAIAETNSPALEELKSNFSSILDKEIYKLYAIHQKPIILGIDFPSMDGSATNCADYGLACQDLLFTSTDHFSRVDLEEQALIYQAFLEESIQRSWIYGIVSEDYNPIVAVQDHSSSIYNKPASIVVGQFFNQLTR